MKTTDSIEKIGVKDMVQVEEHILECLGLSFILGTTSLAHSRYSLAWPGALLGLSTERLQLPPAKVPTTIK